MELLTFDMQKGWELPISASMLERREAKRNSGEFFTYLSWTHAQVLLQEHYPGVQVAFEQTPDGSPIWWEEGSFDITEYIDQPGSQRKKAVTKTLQGRQAYVRPYLTDGVKRTPALFYPVMNSKKEAQLNPDMRLINDAMQRAMSKCISTFTGIGLKLYAKEDIPEPPKVLPTIGTDEKLRNRYFAALSKAGVSEVGQQVIKAIVGVESNNDLTSTQVESILSALTPEKVDILNSGTDPKTGERIVAAAIAA